MIQYEHENLFREDSVRKQWTIVATKDGNTLATITNEDIADNSISIHERLTSDNLSFGRCCASQLIMTVYNQNISFKGCVLDVSVSLDGNEPFKMGYYKVESDKPTADRYHRKIEAYDFIYEINNKDLKEWYEGLTFPITVGQLRNSLFSYLGYIQEPINLPNDGHTINKTVDSENGINGGTVLSAICEINGVFGHVTRDNKFRYIQLKRITEGLYPADDLYPSNDLYPADDSVDFKYYKSEWSNLEYEDYICKPIDGVYILDKDGEIYVSTGECKNPVEISSNFLMYELEEHREAMQAVCDNLFPYVNGIWYRPFKLECLANPCIEVGDRIITNSREKIVYSYVLDRTISGVQATLDNIESEGEETRDKMLTSLSDDLARLRDKVRKDIFVNEADIIRIKARNVIVDEELRVFKADIAKLFADYAKIEELVATKATITDLNATNLEVSKKATIANLNATNLKVENLEMTKLNTNELSSTLAALSNVSVKSITTGTGIGVNYADKNWTLRPMAVNIGGTSYVILGTPYS